jgi:hypothetical protein
MIGFEIEISLPVTDQRGALIPGDTALGASQRQAVNIVTDKRSLPRRNRNDPARPYSNIEFVTDAVIVIGSQVQAGRATVLSQLVDVRRIRDSYYNAGPVTLPNASGGVTYTTIGTTARLDPNNGYEEHAGQQGLGDGLYVHYSIGIPLRSFGAFLNRVRAAAPFGQDVPLPRARFRLGQAANYADDIVGRFQHSPRGQQVQDTRALHGYLQLAYTQICAMADYLAPRVNEGQIKNYTVVLSRSKLSDVYALLGAQEKAYLREAVQIHSDDDDNPITHLAGYHENTDIPGEVLQFQERSSRQVRPSTPEIRLLAYATAACTGTAISQQHVFGGMREIDPRDEEGVRLIPVELRTLGSEMKSWAEVQNDLTNLCAWAEEARQNA